MGFLNCQSETRKRSLGIPCHTGCQKKALQFVLGQVPTLAVFFLALHMIVPALHM